MPNNFGEFGWILVLLMIGSIGFTIKAYISYLSKQNDFLRKKIEDLERSYVELKDKISENEKHVIELLGHLKDTNKDNFDKLIYTINDLKLTIINEYVQKKDCNNYE